MAIHHVTLKTHLYLRRGYSTPSELPKYPTPNDQLFSSTSFSTPDIAAGKCNIMPEDIEKQEIANNRPNEAWSSSPSDKLEEEREISRPDSF